MSIARVIPFTPAREVKKVADLDSGYTRIANEIYEKIIGSSLTQNQSKVVHAVIRMTYGYNKKNDRIADSQISKITNLPRQKVNKAKNELIAMNIINREANKIGINKDISRWDFCKCHQNNDNVTKVVTKSVTKVVTRVSPKQSHTKDIISKDNKNTMSFCNDDEPKNNSKKTESNKSQINYQKVADLYNEILGDLLPNVTKISEKRKKLIKSLMTKHLTKNTTDAVEKYFKAFKDRVKPFYFGENKTGWVANFDFVIRESTVLAVREGTISKAEFVS